MRQDDRRTRSGDRPGPIEPGSVLHRVLVMIAQEIARSRARGLPASTPPADSSGQATSTDPTVDTVGPSDQ